MNRLTLTLAAMLACTVALADDPPRSASPQDAEVYIISPADGATVKSPFTVRFGLKDMGVAPAGVPMDNTGHHHLLIDVDSIDPAQSIPADANHIHFGKGQTETTLELPPGKHVLQLVLGDHLHRLHQPPVISTKVHITVE